MTENKRFKLHINWFNKEKTEGEATLIDNGQPLLITEHIGDARLLKNILNELYDENNELRQELNCEKPLFTKKRLHQENQQLTEENERLKHEIEDFQELLAIKEREEFLKPIIQQIEEARERERTNLGKSVIQQLLEQLQ